MDRLWKFLKGLLGRRTDAAVKPDPQLIAKFGNGDYVTEVWLDGHRWQYDQTVCKWVNTNHKEQW